MSLSSQKPKMGIFGNDFTAKRARYFGLRAVARALGLPDFVEMRHTRRELRRRAQALRFSRSTFSRT
jgi:hypothetical protein